MKSAPVTKMKAAEHFFDSKIYRQPKHIIATCHGFAGACFVAKL
jgi:hypothetical protein